MVVVVWSLSHVWPSVAPWTGAHQAPLSLGFSRQEHQSGLHFLQGIFPTQGLSPVRPHCRQISHRLSHQAKLLWTSSQIRYLYLHAFAHTQYTPRVNLTVTAVSQLISEVRKTLESHFHSLLGMRKPEGCNRCIMNSSGKHQKWWNC